MKKAKTKNNSVHWFVSHIITLFIGIIITIFGQVVFNVTNRPIIEIYPMEMSIYQKVAPTWEAIIKIKLLNRGSNDNIINIKNVGIVFPQISKRIQTLNVNKIIELKKNTTIDFVAPLRFPEVFKKLRFENIPTISSFSINVFDYHKQEDISYTLDSNSISFKMVIGEEKRNMMPSENVKVDSVNKKAILKTRTFTIVYKGEAYINKVFPPNTQIDYLVKDDKIYVEYLVGAKEYKANQIQYFENVIFIPNENIKDKIVLPVKQKIKLFTENRKSESIDYSEHIIDIEPHALNYIYIFK